MYSAELTLLHVPRHRLSAYGRLRAVAISGLSAWNSLADPVHHPNSTKAAFRHLLRTHLFARYRDAERFWGRTGKGWVHSTNRHSDIDNCKHIHTRAFRVYVILCYSAYVVYIIHRLLFWRSLHKSDNTVLRT